MWLVAAVQQSLKDSKSAARTIRWARYDRNNYAHVMYYQILQEVIKCSIWRSCKLNDEMLETLQSDLIFREEKGSATAAQVFATKLTKLGPVTFSSSSSFFHSMIILASLSSSSSLPPSPFAAHFLQHYFSTSKIFNEGQILTFKVSKQPYWHAQQDRIITELTDFGDWDV